MSKVRKKQIERQKVLSELDIKFEKIIQFSGWIFLLVFGGFIGGWILLDTMLEIIDLSVGAITFSFIIFTGTNSAVSFGVASKVKKDRSKKREIFLDWLLGEFLLCMFAIFSVAAYQW
ncbi:MAG: hypothetical protein ACFE94_15645 [Candidatus Hodarchaeota archaeon]